jgi:hypothetical protein
MPPLFFAFPSEMPIAHPQKIGYFERENGRSCNCVFDCLPPAFALNVSGCMIAVKAPSFDRRMECP